MQEFSSISVSTYEPGSLVERLTEKSALGWEVVSIVTTGSTVTAYLSRATEADASPAGDAHGAAAAVDTPGDRAPGDEPAASDEPAADGSGWAMNTGAAAAATAASSADEPTATTPAPEPAAEPAAAEPAPEPATPEPAAEPAATASAAPAGWYADPSARYELRYWDGSTWTEHVSRAGQQYTDPPVA